MWVHRVQTLLIHKSLRTSAINNIEERKLRKSLRHWIEWVDRSKKWNSLDSINAEEPIAEIWKVIMSRRALHALGRYVKKVRRYDSLKRYVGRGCVKGNVEDSQALSIPMLSSSGGGNNSHHSNESHRSINSNINYSITKHSNSSTQDLMIVPHIIGGTSNNTNADSNYVENYDSRHNLETNIITKLNKKAAIFFWVSTVRRLMNVRPSMHLAVGHSSSSGCYRKMSRIFLGIQSLQQRYEFSPLLYTCLVF